MFSVFCKRFCCILNKIVKELMYLLIFHPFLKPNFVAITLDQTVNVLCRTGHVQIFQVVVRSKNWSICSLTVFTVFLKLQFYFDNPFWQIWINIQYLYPIEIPLRGIARNCSRIAQPCAEMRGILRNFVELCELRGAIKIYLDWNPNQNTLIYSESICNMQSYEKLAFCI